MSTNESSSCCIIVIEKYGSTVCVLQTKVMQILIKMLYLKKKLLFGSQTCCLLEIEAPGPGVPELPTG